MNTASADFENDVVLSVVVPIFNEAESIGEFYRQVKIVLDRLNEPWEIVCVNDGSSDATLSHLTSLHHADNRVKVINLSRNFGKEIALTAGIDHACGQAIIPIDADLQDPPELIAVLVEKWREGYDIVNATRRTREGENWLKRTTAAAFFEQAQFDLVLVPHGNVISGERYPVVDYLLQHAEWEAAYQDNAGYLFVKK